MKKLNKLQINPEKIMKNEDLITHKGGSCTCCCVDYQMVCCYGYLLSESGNCEADCQFVFGSSAGGMCGNCGPYCPPCSSY